MGFSERLESFSNSIGKMTLAPAVEYLRSDYTEKFNVVVSGKENLEAIKNKPHIIFSNHNSLEAEGKDSGTRPDHLFIYKQIYGLTNERVAIVGQTDYEITPNNSVKRAFQEKVLSPIKKGLYESIEDLIPIKNNPKKLNRGFVDKINEMIDDKKKSILIFPQVLGDIDYNPELPFRSGIFHIYKNRQKRDLMSVPLLPICVIGCDSWRPYKNQEIKIIFGKPFYLADNLSKDNVSLIMRNKITELRKEMDNW